jgi:endonuclease G
MVTRLALALLAAILAAGGAQADSLNQCASLLPNGVAPIYLVSPEHHTELCHAPAFALSHDDDAHEPRWVAWVVTAEHLKINNVGRTDDFRSDPDLPCIKRTSDGNCRQTTSARPSDYRGSGYDQGHMSDAEDNGWSDATEHLSFLMSNMIPQCPSCNRATWRYIENWTRKLTGTRPVLYVMSGPVLGQQQMPQFIGKDKVKVPSASWKLVLDLAGGEAWSFIVSNDASVLTPGSDISPYQVTPDVVELAADVKLPIPDGIDKTKRAPLQ